MWLVDEHWPAAAAVDAVGTVTLARWPASDTTHYSAAARLAVADGVGIVVQDGEQVSWVRRTGSAARRVDRGLTLRAADPEVAWLTDGAFVDAGDPRSDGGPQRTMPLPTGRIVALHRDGTRTTVPTPSRVGAVEIADAEVVLTMARRPVTHRIGSTAWSLDHPTSRVRVDRDELLRTGLARAVAIPTDDAAPAVEARLGGWSWLESDPQIIRRYGVSASGLLWWVGAPPGGDRIERQAIAVGHDPISATEVLRLDLGRGLVRSARAVGDELWVAVARRRFLPFAPRDGGVDVLAVSAHGGVRVVHSADSIDITASAPPLLRPAAHLIEDHATDVRAMFDHLQEYWQAPDCASRPLSEGLTDASVSVVDTWPHTRVVVTLRHPRRPGVLLRRTLRLFDDAGQPIDYEYADIALMEDLDTDYLAPADEAVDGVLDT